MEIKRRILKLKYGNICENIIQQKHLDNHKRLDYNANTIYPKAVIARN